MDSRPKTTKIRSLALQILEESYEAAKKNIDKALASGAIDIGAYDENTYKYLYECPNCQREVGRHKKMRVTNACSNCCKTYNGGKFTRDYALVLKLVN